MENIIKTMESITVPGMGTLNTSNLAELVPEDERAVDEIEFQPMVGNIRDVLKASISEEDQAIEDGECGDKLAAEIAQAEKLGCFSAANGMAQITNVLDGRLFASVQVDKEGKRNITFCERYESGEFSPKMQIAQADLIVLCRCNMNPDLIHIPSLKSRARKVMSNICLDYFNKFNGGGDPMNMPDILQALMKVRADLPVYKEATEEELAKQFYKKVVHCLETSDMLKANKWIYKPQSYYALTDEALDILAEVMDMRPNALVEKLKQYNLLYRTGKASGYKTRVRINFAEGESESYIKTWNITGPTLEWCYCIYKLQNLGK